MSSLTRLLPRSGLAALTRHAPSPFAVHVVRRLIKTGDGPKEGGHGHHAFGDPPGTRPENRGINLDTEPSDIHKGWPKGSVITEERPLRPAAPPRTVDDFRNPDLRKHWISLGFDDVNQEEDIWWMHYTCFLVISCLICGTCWIWYYMPDLKFHDWAGREAFIELARREALGGEIISKDYVPAKNIRLPTEEEIQGYPIII